MRAGVCALLVLVGAVAAVAAGAPSVQPPLHGAADSTGVPDEAWGFVDLKRPANLFWWLYGADKVPDRTKAPLILWLQGGPGGSSTGFGNFLEIGPHFLNGTARETTWVAGNNIIFLDQPTGTGWSHASKGAYATDEETIASDVATALMAIMEKVPALLECPFYIFSESYGGKMAASIAWYLTEHADSLPHKLDLRAVALGDSWISGIDYVDTWAAYLQSLSVIDMPGATSINSLAVLTQKAVARGDWDSATQLWGQVEDEVMRVSENVDFYNALLHNQDGNEVVVAAEAAPSREPLMKVHALSKLAAHALRRVHTPSLAQYMNTVVRKHLKIPSSVVWGATAGDVFENLSNDFMRPVVATVDKLLAAGVHVVVYNGQLDLICDTPGTKQWMGKLQWPGLDKWRMADRQALMAGEEVLAFRKRFENFTFFDIMKAGHMVPHDNGAAALAMLADVVVNTTSKKEE